MSNKTAYPAIETINGCIMLLNEFFEQSIVVFLDVLAEWGICYSVNKPIQTDKTKFWQ